MKTLPLPQQNLGTFSRLPLPTRKRIKTSTTRDPNLIELT